MYCSKCGKEISEDSNYCYSCGSKVEVETRVTTQNNQSSIQSKIEIPPSSKNKSDRNKWWWLKWWKFSDDEIRSEVNNYDSKKRFRHSYTMASVMFIGFIIFSTLTFSFISGSPTLLNYIEIFIWIVFAYFIYKGNKIIIICSIVLWTIDKVTQLYYGLNADRWTPSSILSPIFFWYLFTGILYRTYKVECYIEKKLKSINNSAK